MANAEIDKPPAISATGITKDFFLLETARVLDLLRAKGNVPSHRALDDVTIIVPKGEFAGVLGHNGAGKSTLLRTMGQIYAPTGGSLRTRGEITGIFELGVAANEFLTGREYAMRAFDQSAGRNDDRDVFIEEVRDFAELDEFFDRPVRTYSAGMKARLYFAVVTSFHKDIYLIDEVLTVGDTYFRQRCWRKLREFKAQGVSGVLATHDWSAILKLCEQCFVLDHGKVIGGGESYGVVREYLGYEAPTAVGPTHFGPDMQTVFRCRTGDDLVMAFPVRSESATRVQFGVSIELKRKDVGWENVMLLDPKEVSLTAGANVVDVTIPQVPLSSGHYLLHVFIVRREPKSGFTTVLDARTWYHGNSLSLEVTGEETPGVAVIAPTLRMRRKPSP